MGKDSGNKTPYVEFGNALKALRAESSRTSAEVSGAVEIDEIKLKAYEMGVERPSKDILFLLLQHFNVDETSAQRLWKLAGYTNQPDLEQIFTNDDYGNVVDDYPLVKTAADPVVYTDLLQVMVNNYGVIMNFMQGAGPHGQPAAAARVGMSLEHARTVVEVLSRTLQEAEKHAAKPQSPRQLGSGTEKKRDSDSDSS